MAETRRPITTFLVGTTAAAALLVIVGLRVQYAVIESTSRPVAAPATPVPRHAAPAAASPSDPPIVQCDALLEQTFGAQAYLPPSVKIDRQVSLELKRLPGPERPPRLAGALTYHVALIAPDSHVRKVWTLVGPDPAWPEYDHAVEGALLAARLDPPVRDGRPVPVCSIVSPTVRWK